MFTTTLRQGLKCTLFRTYSQTLQTAKPLKSLKPKSTRDTVKHFEDIKSIQALGGNGGDGCISFLHLWSNEFAGPDGGDGGNGGHVIFQASNDVKDLSYIPRIIKGEHGEKGYNKDCHGKNADHNIIKVPVGTIVRNKTGKVVGDLSAEGILFIAARGGAGGKGNHFFITDTEQSPQVCEYGAEGETLNYTLEIKSMAHIGLIGYPNAGKSTLLRAISRARPKVAPYPFTTLKPHLGVVLYDDYEQIAVADLPGLIPDSHKNKGLGIQFLKHAERCTALMYILDASSESPWEHLETLRFELSQFSSEFLEKPQIVIANKIDIAGVEDNVDALRKKTSLPVIPISAKHCTNLHLLLTELRLLYDKNKNIEN